MSKINGAFSIKGASGKTYIFNMYTVDTSFKSVDRICIFTNRTFNGEKYTHSLISIELVNDLSQIKKNQLINANCICVMRPESDSESEIADIRKANTFSK